MKKILLLLLAAFFLACNNEGNTDTTRSDSTVIEQDNTVNKDTGMNNIDTMNRGDSIK